MANLKNTVINDTGFLEIPSGTTSQRPSSPATGMFRFNTDIEGTEIYNGTEWVDLKPPPLGSEQNPAPSAQAIKDVGDDDGDGVYFIDLPTVGSTPVYCIMDSSAGDGGGYMLALKATRGTTFNYNSSYWTSTNTLNTTNPDRSNTDAKFDVFNYYVASEFIAFFPDLNNGGQTSGFGSGWHWRVAGQNRTCLSRFQTETTLSNNPRGESMYVGSGFSNQLGFQRWSFNYTGDSDSSVRWGFGWNNENNQGSNDVSSGIGMTSQYESFSAGDHINCCAGTTGVNRSARVEIYVK